MKLALCLLVLASSIALAAATPGGKRGLLISCPDDDCVVADVPEAYPYITSLTVYSLGLRSKV